MKKEPGNTYAEHVVDAQNMLFRDLNEQVKKAVADGAKKIRLQNVLGHRYIGCGLEGKAEIVVEGVPGNDLACFMDGVRVVVNGNAQDGVANTMSSGDVMIHGDAGDVLGYSMRGGRVFVRGNAGYRVGIHMKAFKERAPVVIIGGKAMDYFGEYMAGGTLIVLGLGLGAGMPLTGDFLGTGMHGGEIFINGAVDGYRLGREVGVFEMSESDKAGLKKHLDAFQDEFDVSLTSLDLEKFTRLAPISRRPYGKIYVY